MRLIEVMLGTNTTALYAQVATNTIRAVMSRLRPLPEQGAPTGSSLFSIFSPSSASSQFILSGSGRLPKCGFCCRDPPFGAVPASTGTCRAPALPQPTGINWAICN